MSILNRTVIDKVTFKQSVKGASQGSEPYLGKEPVQSP